MSGFTQVSIGGYPEGGLTTDKKPLMLADQAFSKLENAYVFRYRVKKREGTTGLGRLRRDIATAPFFVTGVSPYTLNFLTQTGFISNADNANPGQVTTFTPHNLVNGNEVYISGVVGAVGYNNAANNPFTITVVDAFNFTVGKDATAYGVYVSGGFFYSNRRRFPVEQFANIVPGSVVYTILSAPPRILTDDGMGNLVSNIVGSSGVIDYDSGVVTITTDQPAGTATTLSYSYYPALPVEGSCKQDINTPGIDNTIYFDTTYAYQFVGSAFQELVSSTPTVWSGSVTQPFWSCNYQGVDPSIRYFFVTNNHDPIRYYNNTTWTDLTPIIADNPPSAAQSLLYKALIIIPYYGRLVALNTFEGTTASGVASASNFYARARFSQIGDPTAVDAWRSDIYGKGGFLDAPTNESIVSAAFFRNTLIVFFEYSTWQLRYIGEYGLPFIFERISSDFGSSSTYSSVIRDEEVDTISARGVIGASAGGVGRIDGPIPETAFSFDISGEIPNFVHGARDFEKELIYWNFLDTGNQAHTQTWPNSTLVYNYQNKTWATFRDSITCFGPTQLQLGITWDSVTTLWDDEGVDWDTPDDQSQTNYIACGNQVGFVSIYENQDAKGPIVSKTNFAPSLFIFDVIPKPVGNISRFTIPHHNLADGELIYLTGLLWSSADPGLNNIICSVTVLDENNVQLSRWGIYSYYYITLPSTATYIGGGVASLLPKINIVGKDFNPFQAQGKQFKLSYIDFQVDSNQKTPSIPAVTIQLFVNSYLGLQANLSGHFDAFSIPTADYLVHSALTSGFIQFIYRSNPCKVKSDNHSLYTGAVIYIANVIGMTQINSGFYTVTVEDANNFTLDVNSVGFSDYVSGGIYNVEPKYGTPYQIGSEYAWYRFYSTQYGQYLRVAITYDDVLMNQLATHQSRFELNGMNIFFREGGRLCN